MGFRDTLKKWDEEDKKAGGIDLPEVSEIFPNAQPEAPAPVAAAPKPMTDYRTDTATNPEQARQIAAQKVKDANDAPAFGYGVARGATLGGVDRLVGLGTLIGEHLGASDEVPARPGAYQEGRREYLAGEDKSRATSPGMHALGEIVGAVPLGVAAPQSLPGRLAVSGGMGAAAGALNTRQDDVGEMAKNAAIGGGIGVAIEGTAGSAMRKAIREAPKREIDTTVRDVMESEAGRATATTGKKLARDIEDIRDVLKQNPDARAAVRGEAKDALPVITAKADAAYAGQTARYAVVDQALKPMTVTQLLGKIVEAEKDVPEARLPLVKKGLKALRDSLREDFAPKWSGAPTWSGQKLEISTEQLRKWVSSVQGTAEAAMGGINGTNAAKVPSDLAKIANKILEDRLDAAATKGGAGVAKTVSEIRESDRQVSAWLGIKRALEDRQVKELAQNAGLNTRLNQSNAANANAAGAALAMSGHPIVGATVAGKGLIAKGANAAGRAINNRVLTPLQEAAERGAAVRTLTDAANSPGVTLAMLSRMALEQGIPQSVARFIFETKQKRAPLPPAPVPVLRQPVIVAPTPPPQGPSYPKEYATSTRTQ